MEFKSSMIKSKHIYTAETQSVCQIIIVPPMKYLLFSWFTLSLQITNIELLRVSQRDDFTNKIIVFHLFGSK